jgi:hypothetical protein
MKANIVLLPGDGIGPDVVDAAVRVLNRVAERFGHEWTFSKQLIGGVALKAGLPPLPDATLAAAKKADAILLGAVGDPSFDNRPPAERPEAALLGIRRELGVFANLRPARVWPGLEEAGPLKPSILAGTDLVVVRELLGGLYYGKPRGIEKDNSSAVNTMAYTRPEIERVSRVAFQLAQRRKRRVLSVDKANVLEVSRLWRTVITDVSKEFPDVQLTHELVDAAAMKLALAPSRYREHVRRHSVGRSRRGLRLAGPAAVGQPRHRRRTLRARSWVGAGHRRQGHRQSDRHDGIGRHAPDRRPRPAPGGGLDHCRDRGGAAVRPADRRRDPARYEARRHSRVHRRRRLSAVGDGAVFHRFG